MLGISLGNIFLAVKQANVYVTAKQSWRVRFSRFKKEKLIFVETVYGDLMIQEFTKITGLNLGESSMSGLKSQQHEKPSKHFE